MGTAVLGTYVLGTRASELMGRQVRDLDAGGSKLIIKRAKTEAGNRTTYVPDDADGVPLRELLQTLCVGKAMSDFIFPAGHGKRGVGKHRSNKLAARSSQGNLQASRCA